MIDDVGYDERFGAFYVVDGGRLVGSAGFFGPPDPLLEVEIGYSICAGDRRRGHASAAIAVLCLSAQSNGCDSVRACVRPDNAGSIAALRRNGFTVRQPGDDDLAVASGEDPVIFERRAPIADEESPGMNSPGGESPGGSTAR